MPVRRALAAVAAAALLTSCGSGSSAPTSTPSGPTGPVASPPHTFVSSLPTDPTSGPSSAGSSDHPAALTPTTDLMTWQPLPGSTRDVVTVGGDWKLTVDQAGKAARLDGPHPRTIPAGQGARISDALLTGTHALVVSEDKQAQTPDVATLVDLGSGKATTLDRTSTPPTSVGGTWALGPVSLVHATAGKAGSYCAALVALASGAEQTRVCVPPRNGISRAALTADGATLMRFDAQRPSCRTLVGLDGSTAEPLAGVTACKGWDSAPLAGGAIWSEIPNERRIQAAHFYAHAASGWYDLGPGTSGSLTACGGAAYFVRDPEAKQDPATLLRWDPADATLATVFASKGRGNAFLSSPRCGGDHLTVTAFSSSGDQQVTTAVGGP